MKLALAIITLAISMSLGATEKEQRFTVPEITRPHPRLLVDMTDIAVVKDRIRKEQEPTFSVWKQLNALVEGWLEMDIKSQPYTGTDAVAFYRRCLHDSSAARDLAIAYQISGNREFADKAIEILNAWVSAEPMPALEFTGDNSYPNAGMLVARSMIQFVWAYDLLYDRIDPQMRLRQEAWFRQCEKWIKIGEARWEENDYFDKQYYQNHLCAASMTLAAIGYVLGDRSLVQYSLESNANERDFLDLIEGMILMEGDEPYYREPEKKPVQTGEIIDRYRHYKMAGHWKDYVTKPNRGLQYCLLSMNLMNITAHIHYKNGINLFGYTAPGGENLRLPAEFYADFYRLMDSSIKGGFYDGETKRMGLGDDRVSVFEISFYHYSESEELRALMENTERTEMGRTSILGYAPLLFGLSLEGVETE